MGQGVGATRKGCGWHGEEQEPCPALKAPAGWRCAFCTQDVSAASPAAAAFRHSPSNLPRLPWRMSCLNVRALSPCTLPCPGMLGWTALLQQPSPAGAAWGFTGGQVGPVSLVSMSRGREDCHCAAPQVTA